MRLCCLPLSASVSTPRRTVTSLLTSAWSRSSARAFFSAVRSSSLAREGPGHRRLHCDGRKSRDLSSPEFGGVTLLLITTAILSLGNAMASPSLTSLASKISSEHDQGGLGILQAGASLATCRRPRHRRRLAQQLAQQGRQCHHLPHIRNGVGDHAGRVFRVCLF